MRARNLYRKL